MKFFNEAADQGSYELDATPEVQTELAEISLEDVISRLEQQDSRLQGVDNMQHTVSSQLGRMQNLQSAVDKLSNDSATEDLRLQVQQLSDNFEVISEALTDLIPEEAQMAMRNKQLENRLKRIGTRYTYTNRRRISATSRCSGGRADCLMARSKPRSTTISTRNGL